jgi:hypothetical protein
MQRFLGEESMFDDSDRRLRVQRTTTTPLTPPVAQSNGAPPAGAFGGAPPPPIEVNVADQASGSTTTVGSGAPFGAFGDHRDTAAPSVNSGAPGRSVGGGYDSSGVRVTTATDARPQVGGARSIAGGAEGELDELEIERQRLQGLAEQLKAKADEFQRRAATLK